MTLGAAGACCQGEGAPHTPPHSGGSTRRTSIREGLSDITCGDVAIGLVPDGTGLAPATRSEYVRVAHRPKRGFLRLTIMISKETLEIVAFELTKDTVGEPTAFESLLENALKNMGVGPEERRRMVRNQRSRRHRSYRTLALTADGGYDSRGVFSARKKLGIRADIRIHKNANCKAGGADRAGTEAVLDQLGGGAGATPAGLAAPDESGREANRRKRKIRVRYGTRWLVETVISAFKGTYGDAVMAKKMENIRREIRPKICTYSRMLRIGREAAMRA